jgi:hypothetical protein
MTTVEIKIAKALIYQKCIVLFPTFILNDNVNMGVIFV